MLPLLFLFLFILGVLLIIAAMAPSGLGAILVAGFFLWAIGGFIKGATDYA